MTVTAELEQPLQILLARQPIFTKNRDVAAYELLFRDDTGEFVAGLNEDETTVNVLLNTFASVIDERTNRPAPVYLKVTDAFLLQHEIPDLPKDRFIIEILGSSQISEHVIERIHQLVADGFAVALADYDPDDPRFTPLLSIVHIIKLDVQKLGFDLLADLVKRLRTYGVDLLADKVETDSEFRQCVELGFEYFMGYFLSRPELVHGRKVKGNKLVLLELLQEFDKPGAGAKSIEALALKDPELTFKILRLVNSASLNLNREVSSLSHAIALLGMEQVKRWVMLFLSSSDGEKPMNYFFVGLLSQLDALLGIPLPELIQQVPLEQELKLALTERQGEQGQLLDDVCLFEQGKFERISAALPKQFFDVAYRHSIEWANQIVKVLV